MKKPNFQTLLLGYVTKKKQNIQMANKSDLEGYLPKNMMKKLLNKTK